MKKVNESSKSERNSDLLNSEISGFEILSPEEMSCVRGGENDGTGGEPIIIRPKI
jgi:hypothetical protein